jgi:hypothetical protein
VLINSALGHEDVWESGDIFKQFFTSQIELSSQLQALANLTPRKRPRDKYEYNCVTENEDIGEREENVGKTGGQTQGEC